MIRCEYSGALLERELSDGMHTRVEGTREGFPIADAFGPLIKGLEVSLTLQELFPGVLAADLYGRFGEDGKYSRREMRADGANAARFRTPSDWMPLSFGF